jgi:hypothetical protein
MLVGVLCTAAWGAAGSEALRKGFEQPPADARVMMRWWWFGPAVTKGELERELKTMKAGGLGGVEIQPVYPLTVDDPAKGLVNLRYLSAEFLDALRFAAEKGRELGLRVDLTLGSGWPYGGPHISRELAAMRLRVEKLGGGPRLREGERVIAEFPEAGIRFIEGYTGQMVKRASVGAEGYVLDHYNRAALDRHLQAVGEPLLKGFGARPPYAIFCDSLEVFGSDWTGGLLAEFQKRRGYDLKPLLPALTGPADEAKGAIRNDWAQTLTELSEENFLKPLRDWAQKHGARLRMQAYGTPPVTLASQRLVDLADGEQTQWRRLSSARWASSANHVLGRPVTASETWTWLHSPVFAATPLDVKAEADIHFIQGVNQLIGHGWPYSPAQAGKPGWAFYAAGVFNDSNPWWGVMPDLALYLQRVSWLMRQGRPVSDVALYLPVADIRAGFTAGTGRVSIDRQADEAMGRELIPALLDAGYSFDAVDDGLLEEALAKGGYKAVVLPRVERIPLETYRRLERYVEGGGLLLAAGRTPRLAPGKAGAAGQAQEIAAISRRLFEAGQAVFAPTEAELVARLKGKTAAGLSWAPASSAIGYAHRSVDGTDVYFVANTGNTPYEGRLETARKGARAEVWDALTGRRQAFDGSIALPPYGSAVIVMGEGMRPAPAPRQGTGKELDLSGGWEVTFAGTARKVSMQTLKSWTDDPATRFYSGVAVYEKEIRVGREMLGAELDFGTGQRLPPGPPRQAGMRAWYAGPVRDAAVVFVNGKRAGAVFAPPYRLDLTGVLKEGSNRLRIEVGNTWLNGLAERGEPDYAAVTAKYGERFQMQDMKRMAPEPSGLLGAVKLRAR